MIRRVGDAPPRSRRAGDRRRAPVGGRALAAAAVLAAASAVAWTAPPYRDGPPPGHTGGFGEPTCAECHFGEPVNAGRGALETEVPASFEPGRTYRIAVELTHPEMAAAGFQLAVRLADGEQGGEPAGTLRSVGPRTSVIRDTATGVQYGHHTPAGAALLGTGEARWVLEWTAPTSAADVVVHVAANAANDDASEFGDDIFVMTARIPVSPPPP